MRRHLYALATFAALAVPLSAQATCNADLTVTGDGTPGTTIVFSVESAFTDAPTAILAGFGGTGTFPPGMSFLGIGILPPLFPLGGGTTDSSGNFSVSIDVPASLSTLIQGHAQSISVEINPSPMGGGGMPGFPISICTSDVEAFSAGPTT